MKDINIKLPFWHPACMDAFILDWDGVLANTRLDFSAIRKKYFGGQIVPLIERAGTLPHPLDEEAKAEIRRVEMEGAARAAPVDGAHDLIAWLEAQGRPWSVVSRNCRDSILLAAERCGIALPPVVISREEGIVKPDPRALILAAERMGIPPRGCVMLGDFIYDILGARRAAMRGILVERDPAEWGHMADAAWPSLRGLVGTLASPSPLVPWEYHALAMERGVEYLEAVNRFQWRIEGGFRQAVGLARLGVVYLLVPEGTCLEVSEWEDLDLPACHIGQPLVEVLHEVLGARWPDAAAIPECGADRSLPIVRVPEGVDLEGFLSRHLA